MADVKAEIKELGDKIVALTLLDAQALSTYLKDTYGIEAAAGHIRIEDETLGRLADIAHATGVRAPVTEMERDRFVGVSRSDPDRTTNLPASQ